MSYRAFKRLLGETSLERKCRWLLGAGVLLLMTGSFWVYAQQTETLAYEQLDTTGRVLIGPILSNEHAVGDQIKNEFQTLREAHWPTQMKGYSIIVPGSNDPRLKPQPDDLPILERVQSNPGASEESRQAPKEKAYYYYAIVRANDSCLSCHRDPVQMEAMKRGAAEKAAPNLEQNAIMARRSRPPLHASHRGWLPHEPRRADLIRHRHIAPHHRRQLPHHSLCHRQAGQAPEGSLRGDRDGRTQHSQRDPDRRRVRGPVARLQPHAPQPHQHPGSQQEADRRPRPQGR